MEFLAGILLLCILVFFHELGHFLVAKLMGVKVLVFSIGFGPKIIKKTIKGTEYCLSAIPLGGYVKMFGESLEEECTEEEKKFSFLHQKVWKKSLIAFAGPFFNFILPIFLLFFLNLSPQKTFAPIIGTLLEGGEAKKQGLKPLDKIIALDGNIISDFNEISRYISKHKDKSIKLDVVRKTNLGEKNLQIEITPNNGKIGIMPSTEKPVIMILKNSHLFNMGLQSFDEILEINNNKISSFDEIFNYATKESLNIKIKRDNKEVDLVVNGEYFNGENVRSSMGAITKVDINHFFIKETGLEIGDQILSINDEKFLGTFQIKKLFVPSAGILKHKIKIQKLDSRIEEKEIFIGKEWQEKLKIDDDGFSLLGFLVFESFSQGQIIEKSYSMKEAFLLSVEETYNILAMTASSFWLMFKGDVSTSQIGGPLMLVDVAKGAMEKGFSYYIFIMCMLSVNLGLLNLLPIPALDGGHLLLFLIEAIKGKPLDVKTRRVVTQIGVVFLLMVMALALFNDISRLFKK